MAYCLYYSTITKHSNLHWINRLQFPWLTAFIVTEAFHCLNLFKANSHNVHFTTADNYVAAERKFSKFCTTPFSHRCMNQTQLIWIIFQLSNIFSFMWAFLDVRFIPELSSYLGKVFKSIFLQAIISTYLCAAGADHYFHIPDHAMEAFGKLTFLTWESKQCSTVLNVG